MRNVPRHSATDARLPHHFRDKRTKVLSLKHYLASRTLLWAGHVARIAQNRLPKRLMLSWISEPRVAGGREMAYGRSLQRHLAHFNPPIKLGKPFVRQSRGDTRVTPEDKQCMAEQRAAEIAMRRADFNAHHN